MSLAANIVVALVGLLHVYILVLEMFLWTGHAGRKAFGLTPEFAEQTRVLGANQGLYNGFLAAGLIWSLVADPALARPVATYVLLCVLVAGIYGAMTASRRILYVQAVPAALAILALYLA